MGRHRNTIHSRGGTAGEPWGSLGGTWLASARIRISDASLSARCKHHPAPSQLTWEACQRLSQGQGTDVLPTLSGRVLCVPWSPVGFFPQRDTAEPAVMGRRSEAIQARFSHAVWQHGGARWSLASPPVRLRVRRSSISHVTIIPCPYHNLSYRINGRTAVGTALHAQVRSGHFVLSRLRLHHRQRGRNSRIPPTRLPTRMKHNLCVWENFHARFNHA